MLIANDLSRARQAPRVACDGRMLGREGGTGVSTFASTLGPAAAEAGFAPELILDRRDACGPRPEAHSVARFAAASRRGARLLEGAPASLLPAPYRAGWLSPDLFREAHAHFALYGRFLSVRCPRPPALVHWTYPIPLILEGAPNIYTVHDLIPLVTPRLSEVSERRHRRILDQMMRHASHVIATSERSRQDFIDHFRCDETFVSNTWQSVAVNSSAEAASLPPGLSRRGYFLFCGSIEPRKNLRRLIEAHGASGGSLPLVIVGPEGWRASEALPPGPLPPGVIRLDWVERGTLLALVSQARALLFPSLAEGFGLPVIEAMTLGTPVMTSDHGALAEVGGAAALLVDPHDVAAMADAIRRLEAEEGLCASLAAAGRARARLFSMSAYAKRLGEVYRQVLADATRLRAHRLA
jgi:glycosyltransferase involved in cell wall biosynthesis